MSPRRAARAISVNAIAPGPTLTGLTRANYTDPEARRATEAVIPLGRLGQPDDLVGAVLFLASDVRCAGVRGLLNFVGCALGGARDEAVGIAVKGAHAVLRAAARDREQARRAARRA